MKNPLVLMLLLGATANASDEFPIDAGNGLKVTSPADKNTVDVVDCKAVIKVPVGMVYVPAGMFTFGKSEQRDLPAFCIGRFEVTNAEYHAFVAETGRRSVPRYWKNQKYPDGKASHPVLFVSLDDAEDYCAWVTRKTGWKAIIPSAEQWEKAARGPQGFIYPWGNEKGSRFNNGKFTSRFNYNAVCAAQMLEKDGTTKTRYVEKSSRAGEECMVRDITASRGQVFGVNSDGNVTGWIDHTSNTGFVNTQIYRDLVNNGGFTTPVGSFENGISHYGCYDMAGNAYEWTTTLITAENGSEKGKQVNDIRGGSWYSTGRSGTSLCTGEGRQRHGGYHSVGFRLAIELPKE